MTRRLLGTAAETVRQWADAAGYALTLAGTSVHEPRPGRRILVVTRALPPRFHGGSPRQLALLRALDQAGWGIDALSDAAAGPLDVAGAELVPHLPKELGLHRWPPPTRHASWRVSPKLSGGFGSIRQILSAADGLQRRPSLVLASGPPFAEFVAASVLARRLGVPCILDYRDEWTTSAFAFVERGRNDVRWERRCLAGSTAAVFTTDSMREHYLQTFPVLRHRLTATIQNGWDDTGAFDPATPPPRPDGTRPATIGFFGLLGEHWDFGEFSQTLGRLLEDAPGVASQVRFALYGKVSPENTAAIDALCQPELFRPHGLVPRAEAQRAMAACDALVLFNNPRLARVLPGKTFEYIASRRPILLYGDGGEMASLLKDIPGTIIVSRGDAPALRTALARIVSGDAAALAASAPADDAGRFHRRHRDLEWLQLLDRVVPGGAG